MLVNKEIKDLNSLLEVSCELCIYWDTKQILAARKVREQNADLADLEKVIPIVLEYLGNESWNKIRCIGAIKRITEIGLKECYDAFNEYLIKHNITYGTSSI